MRHFKAYCEENVDFFDLGGGIMVKMKFSDFLRLFV